MGSEKAIITVLCMVYHEDELLLQNRVAENLPGVTFPGGHVEPGESFVEAVKREMQEETGLTILQPVLCGVRQYQSESDERYVMLLFKTNEFYGALESSKEGEMRWIKRNEIAQYSVAEGFNELLQVFDSTSYQEMVSQKEKDGTFLVELY